jgi:O-acetylhomoserine/O-acetylserine sulfhydrylase-like pyridoxal-dependent enzyme
MPIYATTSFVFEDVQHAADLFSLQTFGNIYTRIGNPTTAAFEERMASLEGGTGCGRHLLGQGGPTDRALLTMCQEGDHIVSSRCPLRGHLHPVRRDPAPHGSRRHLRRLPRPDQVEAAITETKVLFGETVGNPGPTSSTSRRSPMWPTDTACR